jgi:haloacetate dehalogenase
MRAKLAPMFNGFQTHTVIRDGVRLHTRAAGEGPPLLLLHGHPQTNLIWRAVAPRLAERFTVVASDLRGYGDSGKPPTDVQHAPYAKRAMAGDQVDLMQAFGFARFAVVGHDRGARVAHRLAADRPDVVERLVVLDIAPTLAMYEQTDMRFARAYWHWFFLIQPAPLPEALIDAAPDVYLDRLMGSRHAGLAAFAPDALAEYRRCMHDPATVHAMCEDYRAAASIDLEHDRADREAGRRLSCPLLALWAAHGIVQQCFDPLAEWRRVADDVRGRPLDCGHYIPEEAPDALLAELDTFLRTSP